MHLVCVLEMVSHEYPYEECKNVAQIWRKVTNGELPQVLDRINKHVRKFIKLCLSPEELRPSAIDLLNHPFLTYKYVSDDNVVIIDPKPIIEHEEEINESLIPTNTTTSKKHPAASNLISNTTSMKKDVKNLKVDINSNVTFIPNTIDIDNKSPIIRRSRENSSANKNNLSSNDDDNLLIEESIISTTSSLQY